ncbi:MAG: glutamine--tRNA ligase/YqeY domain fusion protein [Eubacteriales bacterium]|nr:glutamine--tRNA ligase/YqeY domain fusion protein [Eubacteriales bacterium]MDD7414653.1 glutamine--tRNA ligase/YqeY domain fusion protein [Clostridiales bacterium]MDY5732666.1 glutamine--tRNA ligase/YqeY domain fusion protein [Eubacteriales bacterium]
MEETREIIANNFIEEFVMQDMQKNPVVQTRFPPEPNGYLHIGHAKALCIDFGVAEKFGGKCNLRFDDTNPTKEDVEYVDAIQYDIRWLGFEWDKLRFGSEYFDKCYELAVKLIKNGDAYVCDLTKDEMREYRGTLTEPGKDSPFRNRSIEENLDLFERMRTGEFEDGSRTLRAKIDMASPNINLRDPALYRILHRRHHQTGDKWCIYPMYDFAHPIQDAIEGITHSLCSLEYEAHRPLYNWVIEKCGFEHKPRQIEFARLNMTNTIMSKRYLRRLVEEGYVSGWDDPRMPTLCGMRRRGYTPEAIKDFLERAGVSKADSTVDTAMLEHCVREHLNLTAHRAIAILDPVKVIIDNWDDGYENITLENLPGDESQGTHTVRFGRELYIEREDFMEEPPKKFFRLKPDGEVRLKGAYIVKCISARKDENGVVTEIHCTYDPATRSGECERKVKGTLHWLCAEDAVPAEFRLYESLMVPDANPDAEDFIENINKNSLETKHGFVEPMLAECKAGERYQFMRIGYFAADADHTPQKPVFNRTVGLKDSFKIS